MLHRTFSACVIRSDKFTSKKNLPPTVTKEKWDREYGVTDEKKTGGHG